MQAGLRNSTLQTKHDIVLWSELHVRGGAEVPANADKTGQGEDKAGGLDHYDRVLKVTLWS
jgi:hypothetical protein